MYITSLQGQGLFKASFSRANITPVSSQTLIGYEPRKSEGVRDSIYHKVVVFDDGSEQFYLVSSDLAAIAPPTYDRALARLNKMFGINRDHFWWTNTHTHSAPEVGSPGVIALFLEERYHVKFDENYANFVEDQLVKAISDARKSLVPAKLGVGWGYSRANINRRELSIDNRSDTGENPDGPIDRKIGLIRIENTQGRPIALIANYPIHGTVLSRSDLRISGDVPGEVSTYIEEQIGAPLLFINGALGNIAPRFSVSVAHDRNKEYRLRLFRKLLGEPILKANSNILATTSKIKIKTSSIIVETPKRSDIKSWPEDMKDHLRRSISGNDLIRLPIQFLQINDDVLIWGAPCELFCEVSNEIRHDSPFPYTFYSGLTNGTFGYLCTEDEMKIGGYEPKVSPFSISAAKDVTEGVRRHIEMLSRMHVR